MNEIDLEAIGERVARLERDVRLWKGAAMVTMATIVLLGALIAFSATSRNLVSRSLTIVDEQGNQRIRLDSIEHTPRLRLFDEKGTTRADLAAGNVGAGLALAEEGGNH